MELILVGLDQMFFQLQVVKIEENEKAVLIFVIACAIFGTLAVILDLAFWKIKERSVLQLEHGFKNTLIILFFWAIGAALIGYIGQIVNLFQVSLTGAVTVGFGWPVLFTNLLEEVNSKMQSKEPKQNPTSED